MPPKAKLPQPIDRPLSRAYLREFSGWSTAFPPGLSDPTSLRIMENVLINRDGSARVRPGLKYLSYDELPTETTPGTVPAAVDFVGSHESFFLNDGTRAYLFAVREDSDGTVSFRVLRLSETDGSGGVVQTLTEAGFAAPVDGSLNFSPATTYVRYLQIDNKIFALSNAGEEMRYFTVGATKTAKRLNAIERPDWSVADKLKVVHPDAAWILNGEPLGTRVNRIYNPSFESDVSKWTPGADTELVRSNTAGAQSGSYAARVTSKPTRSNLMTVPLHLQAYGLGTWTAGAGADTITNTVDGLKIDGTYTPNAIGRDTPINDSRRAYANSPQCSGVVAGTTYEFALDWTQFNNAERFGVLYRFYGAGGQVGTDQTVYWTTYPARVSGTTIAAPAGATSIRIYPFVETWAVSSGPPDLSIPFSATFKDVVICKASEDSAYFDGSSGANYFWQGAAGLSASVYHPPKDVQITADFVGASPGQTYTTSAYRKAGSAARTVFLETHWQNATPATISTSSSNSADSSGSWTRDSHTAAAPAATARAVVRLRMTAVPRGEYHYFDAVLFENNASLQPYFDGSTPDTATEVNSWNGTAHASASTKKLYAATRDIPDGADIETPTANTLISSDATKNVYNFGFFYTFTNEVGESASSQITVVRAQRPWVGWFWKSPDGAGTPATATDDPVKVADQLVAYIPTEELFGEAMAQGATSWNLYMLTWSDQDAVPVTGALVATRELKSTSTYQKDGWLQVTPVLASAGGRFAVVPNASNRYNYSAPSKGAQGIVAADRMVLVNDPTAQAVIRWSSNQQGYYTDFTNTKGGGYKTLTSGNLYIPACVKLWQNPQSADTLTVLCAGVDGQSTGYYMAPAQVASQSEATNIMGFEETTATPGTTSPYGCEVLNNALYHPLDEMLMKSTAANYNINHKEVSEQIRNKWSVLQRKHAIVSAQFDNRIYFIVNNPEGALLEDGCMGNEIWVFDAAAETGSWSRFLIQGCSLRKIERGGKVYMSVTRPDGIYYLDPEQSYDEYVSGGEVLQRFIPWRLETNTQGANRAHDAWAHLQQANVVLGNFLGTMRLGVRGYDVNGKAVVRSKVVRNLVDSVEDAQFANPGETDKLLPFDYEDFLLIRQDMKEWFFFAHSEQDENGDELWSSGQINLVQYRYTPVSVNVGYEYGSVETFEYGRATANWSERTTDNGVPIPMTDVRRP